MCNDACIEFAIAQLRPVDIQGKRVLEVGARDVNGSVRSVVEALAPASYLGVDFEEGLGVDEICRAEDLVSRYGLESFDVVLSTEMLEHVRNWRSAISNLKRVLVPGGVVLLTTRSQGFPFHGYPYDFWRFEMMDMEVLFADFSIEALIPDRRHPGVLFKGRKPREFYERNLSAYPLYSMIVGRRAVAIHNREILVFRACYLARRVAIHALPAGRMLPGPIRQRLKRLFGFSRRDLG
jgi:SAM-dependent methyltransferase